jgi:hypothetical protein
MVKKKLVVPFSLFTAKNIVRNKKKVQFNRKFLKPIRRQGHFRCLLIIFSPILSYHMLSFCFLISKFSIGSGEKIMHKVLTMKRENENKVIFL